ncbi:MAG: MFS transporter [Chloroflexota bacterium]
MTSQSVQIEREAEERAGPRDRRPVIALLSANAISLSGNALTALAIPWFVLATTGSASKTGLVAFTQILPTVLAAFLGGALVDRIGPKQMSVFADLASGITVGLVPLLYHTVGLAFWQLLILVFLGAILDTPGNTAREALLPELVQRAGTSRERANGIMQTIQSSSSLVGPVLAGLLITHLGASNVLWVDAATFAVSALLIGLMVPRLPRPAQQHGRYHDEVLDGLRFLRQDRLVLTIIVLAAVLNFVGPPTFTVVMPVFARQEFGSAQALGFILAGFGAGSLLGGAAFGMVGARLPRRMTTIVLLGLSSVAIAGMAWLPPVAVATLLTGAFGFAVGSVNPMIYTLLQERAPAEFRGRIFGTVLGIALLAAPAGMLVAGASVQALGVRTVFIAVAGVQAAVTLATLLQPVLKEMDRPRYAPSAGDHGVA